MDGVFKVGVSKVAHATRVHQPTSTVVKGPVVLKLYQTGYPRNSILHTIRFKLPCFTISVKDDHIIRVHIANQHKLSFAVDHEIPRMLSTCRFMANHI